MNQAPLRALSAALLARLPFADAASESLPLSRLLRLGLFQVSVAMALTLMAGTLNRVMIVELGVSAALVAVMFSIPLLLAPARALIGLRSDTHHSAFGWRRVPYLWNGTLLQFSGLAIMPFALLLLQGSHTGGLWQGRVGAALAFFLAGSGAHVVQTAGLALATDLATERTRPRVVALLYVMLLIGTLLSALAFGAALQRFGPTRLVQVVQGAALLTVVLNVAALWGQEPRNRARAAQPPPRVPFRRAWREFTADRRATRLLVAVGLGTAGFSMQDILLEPYGAQVLHLGVAQTSLLTALMASGALLALWFAARQLARGADAMRLAALGAVVGAFGFAAVTLASPLGSAGIFRAGIVAIGFGSGLFGVATLSATMSLAVGDRAGLVLGAWGAVQATTAGTAVALGGMLRDALGALAARGVLGAAVQSPTFGYTFVYHLEIAALFAALVALGPLARPAGAVPRRTSTEPFGLAELPG
ncbi:MAG: BCD family MFS transporter [Gemmatimonadales bacterium]|jgi:BCD family chlorophyll transporter-like MFS transporter|nr:BCD family MFS transporter [Gemmatimonadales bacterium]